MIEILKKLTSSFGPAGEENFIKEIIKSEIKDSCDDLREDKLGNLIAYKKGKETNLKVMLAAHLDEIGIMVTHIDEEGFLRFTPIGGVKKEILPHKRFVFADGITGKVGTEETKDDDKKIDYENMYLDIGAEDKEKAEELVAIGDAAVFSPDFVDAGGRIIAKSLDDRAGCTALVELMQRINDIPHELYCVFTSQEEVGCRGSKTAAYDINPDIALAVDVTATGDTPESKTREVSLGKGAAIKVMDRGSITHPDIKNLLRELAEDKNINYQFEVLEYGATDAHSMQLSRGGTPGGTVSIPCRYLHSPGEMIDTEDLEEAIKLLQVFVNSGQLDEI